MRKFIAIEVGPRSSVEVDVEGCCLGYLAMKN